jgi:hypothetical protein
MKTELIFNGHQFKPGTITIKFWRSTFEQVNPSAVSMDYDYKYGYPTMGDKMHDLTIYERRRFIKLAIDALMAEYLKECE